MGFGFYAKTKDELHFKETHYKNRPVYETSYLDGNQENSKLEIFKEKKDKEIFWFEKPLVTILFNYKKWNRCIATNYYFSIYLFEKARDIGVTFNIFQRKKKLMFDSLRFSL
jgi:hypothetical protein